MLKIGNKVKAKWSETFIDHVTKDKIYTITRVESYGFYIINDKEQECFPVSSSFINVRR